MRGMWTKLKSKQTRDTKDILENEGRGLPWCLERSLPGFNKHDERKPGQLPQHSSSNSVPPNEALEGHSWVLLTGADWRC